MVQITDPLIGREIDGYKVEMLLGSGGMARVYRAIDLNLDRYVAIKIVAPHLNQDQEYEERFRREARAVAQLRHHNIVGVYRFGESSGLYYMAMDYIDGTDLGWVLDDYHKNGELIGYEQLLRIMTPIASALDYAHGRGVIHRDIKPSNIMITKEGDPVLTDFGLVLMKSEGTRGDVFGSPYYIAPEQAISSAGAVHQSDIYSLGVILYEMLTGRRPFDAESPMQIAMSHMTDPVPEPQSFYPDLHAAFTPVLMKVLAKDAKQRHNSAAALISDLRGAIKKAVKDGATPGKTLKHTSGREMTISRVSITDKVKQYRTTNPERMAAPFFGGDATEQVPVEEEKQPEHTEQPTAPTGRTQTVAAAQKPRSGGGALRWVALLLLVVALAAGGVFGYTQFFGESSPPPVTTLFEGPVSAVEGNIITIYDIEIQLPSDTPLLETLQVGDQVWIEGHLDEEATGTRVTLSHVLATSYDTTE